MKKRFKTLCAAAVLTCCMAFPALAAETKAEYKEAAAPVRSELKSLEAEMKPIREENKAAAAKYKSIRLEKKNGSLSISSEDFKAAKELHKKITEIRKERKESTAKSFKAEAKNAVKAKDFDAALQNMNKVLDVKKDRLDSLKEINSLWDQIDDLLD